MADFFGQRMLENHHRMSATIEFATKHLRFLITSAGDAHEENKASQIRKLNQNTTGLLNHLCYLSLVINLLENTGII